MSKCGPWLRSGASFVRSCEAAGGRGVSLRVSPAREGRSWTYSVSGLWGLEGSGMRRSLIGAQRAAVRIVARLPRAKYGE